MASVSDPTYPWLMTAGSSAAAAAVHVPARCDGALRRAFGFLGKRWNGIVLATLAAGPVGFTDLRRAVGGITDSVLSDRLSELAAAGLVGREVNAGPPVTVRYALTGAGQSLVPVLDSLATWAADNLPEDGCSAVAAAGRTTGLEFHGSA